jgi:hypothetical protein
MNKQFAKTNQCPEESNQDNLGPAINDLRKEVSRRLESEDFFGTVTVEINFRAGKQNWHRVKSEFTRSHGPNSQ